MEEDVSIINSDSMKQKKEQQSQEENTTNNNIKQITNCEEEQPEYYQMMSSDDESDNDLELLTTLAQLHGLVHSPRLSSEINQNLDETDLLHKKIQQNEEEKRNSTLNLVRTPDNDHYDEEQKKNYQRNDDKKPSILFTLTSSALFNDRKSHSSDINLDSDASSSSITSMNELNNSMLSSNQFMIDNLQISNTNNNDLSQKTRTTTGNNDSNCDNLCNQSTPHIVSSNKDSLFNHNDFTSYTNHSNDNLPSLTTQNLENIIKDIHTVTNIIHHDLFPNDEFQQSDVIQIQQSPENMMSSSLDMQVISVVEELVSNTLRLALNKIDESNNQILPEDICEDNNISELKRDDNLLTEHLPTIINGYNEKPTTNEQLLDPFDQKFDSVWINHFETPDDIVNQDPNPANYIQEIIPSPLLTNPFDPTYTSVRNLRIDDNSIFQDDFILYKVINC